MDLSKNEIEDLIVYCGSSPTLWKSDSMQVCCPVHGESNPSMGISYDKQVCHCFSCGFAGGFASLLVHSLPEEFGYVQEKPFTRGKAIFKANVFLSERYEKEFINVSNEKTSNIKRYEEIQELKVARAEEEEVSIPLYKIAPFKSGKETYKYFYDRGFDAEDMKKFMIGRDLDNKTVTIPCFYEDGRLAGVIGRYISKNRKKNERYKIYDFKRGDLLYPMNISKPVDDTIIVVESMLDVIMMHKWGITNVYATMGVEITPKQKKYILGMCRRVILLSDNDSMGREALERNCNIFKGTDIKVLVCDYPSEDFGKDPSEWGEELTKEILDTAHGLLVRRLKRIE